MITVLMVLDAVIGLLLIGSVVMQTPKSAGMGMGGGSDTVFSSSARGLDALLARVTVVLAVLFGVITLFIAKLTSF
ncbi:preprotein translocase subunit SecG [Anaerovibrio sp.]|uniref:preprotein translocase subunit SecG n=1 Tax=Anaerovibrio sp. TaxID=1872532 RepID=UPI002632B802|nr:preprotein translocase subunit SecG [Anaerovibrio sp.]MDD6596855.1 preprotein translocase subunit SecG [Anaerovibrio sp.]MDD7677888.1 preprotein translocase subunit SecG [Anaerovibrio sp.]MDY2604506.1 preprotein translocase subunit SecG [Anaerovibrio sp.]MDY4882795.1 preprotein translocase subunit SecG [Anaerovibrio sp.]